MTASACDTESCCAMPLRVSAQASTTLRPAGRPRPPRPPPCPRPPCPRPACPGGSCAITSPTQHNIANPNTCNRNRLIDASVPSAHHPSPKLRLTLSRHLSEPKRVTVPLLLLHCCRESADDSIAT